MDPERFVADEVAALAGALGATQSPLGRSALEAALSEQARAVTQRAQAARLREGLDTPLIELPYLFADHVGRSEMTTPS